MTGKRWKQLQQRSRVEVRYTAMVVGGQASLCLVSPPQVVLTAAMAVVLLGGGRLCRVIGLMQAHFCVFAIRCWTCAGRVLLGGQRSVHLGVCSRQSSEMGEALEVINVPVMLPKAGYLALLLCGYPCASLA